MIFGFAAVNFYLDKFSTVLYNLSNEKAEGGE